jgi:signal transduction histidine kinase
MTSTAATAGGIHYRDLAPAFHTVRGFTVASAAAAVAVFGAAWDPRLVWTIVLLAVIAVLDSLYRRRHPETSPKPRLLVEALVILFTMVVIGGPALVAAPIAYLLTVALLILPLRRALLIVAFFTACTVGVYFSSISSADEVTQLVLGLATLLVFLGASTVLLITAFRINAQMRAREKELLEEAQAANRAKSEMLTRVSHELRTPLAGVVGFSQILKDQWDLLTEAERTEAIGSIADQSLDLSGLIDDLLITARYEIGELKVTSVPTNLRSQANQVLETWYGRTGIGVEGEAPDAMADPARVRQILRNLVSNAFRYGGPRIRVVLCDDGPAVQVRDDGKGIPTELSERVFGAFYRVPGKQVHPSSIGLGLAVSRDLARMMGGDLSYRHEGGESVFELRLPSAEPAEISPPSLSGVVADQ